MTNAEKYYEVFGMKPDKTTCPTENCKDCPAENTDCINICVWWDDEYKGAAQKYCFTSSDMERAYINGKRDATHENNQP